MPNTNTRTHNNTEKVSKYRSLSKQILDLYSKQTFLTIPLKLDLQIPTHRKYLYKNWLYFSLEDLAFKTTPKHVPPFGFVVLVRVFN